MKATTHDFIGICSKEIKDSKLYRDSFKGLIAVKAMDSLL